MFSCALTTEFQQTEIIQIFSLHGRYVSFLQNENNLRKEEIQHHAKYEFIQLKRNWRIKKMCQMKVFFLYFCLSEMESSGFQNISFDNLFEMPFHGRGISFENGLFLVGYQWVMGKICKGAFVIYSPDKKHRASSREYQESEFQR